MKRPIEALRLLLEADASTGFPEALRSVVPYATVEEARAAVGLVLGIVMPSHVVIPLTRLMVTLIPPVRESPEEIEEEPDDEGRAGSPHEGPDD